MISKKVADNIMSQLDALDARADEQHRLKCETMDGHRLFDGLEVYTADDPFYPAVIVKVKKHYHMAQVKGRCPVDRRKRYERDEYDKNLFVDQKLAFAAKIKEHDEKTFSIKANRAEAIKAIETHNEAIEAHDKERKRLLNEWAITLNKENTFGPKWATT